MVRLYRPEPQIELLEERIALDVTISIAAGITVLIDTNGDLIPDQALAVTDGSIDLVVDNSAVWNGVSFLLSLIGGLGDLNNLLITNSGTGGANFSASFTGLECLEVAAGQTLESANFGTTVGLFGPSTTGTIQQVTGAGTIQDLTTAGDLNSVTVGAITGTIDVAAVSQRGSDTGVSLTITEGGSTFVLTADNGSSVGLVYDGGTDTLTLATNDTASNVLSLTDTGDLIDQLDLDAGLATALGALTVTGDLDGFEGADGQYSSLRVTAASGALTLSDGTNSVTVNPSAAADLTYTGSSDSLVVADFTDGADLTVTDANGLIDQITVAAQGGKSLDNVVVTGDLDAFTAADGDFVDLLVTAATGPLVLSDGTDTVTVDVSAGSARLSYAGSTDGLVVEDFDDGAVLSLTDASGLVDSLSIVAQGGKSLGAVTVTGTLGAFTAADGDYASLRVTALNGALVVNDGSNPVTITTDGATDLTYTGTSDGLSLDDYADGTNVTLTDANGLVDSITVAVQGGKALGAVVVAGDLDSFTGADGDYASLRVTALDGALVVNDGASPVTITTDAATDLTYTGSSDTLSVADYVDGTNLTLTDANGLIDTITVGVQGGKALGAVVMTGDLDSFTGADGDYASLRVTALDGALVVNDGASPVTITTDAATDLTYTGSSDTLSVADYVDGTNLTLTDANGLVDAITVAVQGGKALGAVVMTGDLDSFTGADGDYASLRVTALDGALVVNDGANPLTITTDAATDLTYTGSSDALAVADYVDGTNLTLTDANGLIDAITVAVQGGKALGAVVMTGDLDSFTGADGDYASLRVTALDGALVVNDGANPVTITTDAATDLTYTGATDTLAIADYVDGTNLTLTDANGLIDAITVAVQGGKALGAVVMTGDLDSFTGADGDYASLRVTALNGALVVNDGSNPVTITTDGATDLTYTGTSDGLSLDDYADGTNVTLTDASGLVDSITVAVQGGKALGAVVMTGDLDSFTGADGDYASLRVTALDGALVVNDGANPLTITTDAATDLTYTGSSDTLAVADYVDGTNLTLTDANGLIDAITVAVQGGKALGAVVMTGDLDSFTGADGDYASLRVTALDGALVINDGANPVTITTDAATDLTYTGATDTLAIADYVDGTNLTLTDASGLIDAITVAVQGGKALGAVVMTGDLDSFTGADGDYASLRVTALNGALVVNDGASPVTITTDAVTDLTYTGSSDSLAVADFVDGTNVTLTDANGLIDAITVAVQGGKALGAIVMTGDLDSFTGADGDYASLRVTALDGALVVNDGSNPVTITTDAVTDLTYTGSSDSLAVADYVDGTNLTLTDANGLIDAITVAVQGGKALGAIVMTGDLESFTGADGDYASLRVTALDGALVVNDGASPVTITTDAATDLTYTGATDTLAIADYVDGTNLTLTDANGLIDAITVAVQGGKALGAVVMTGDLDSFTGADGDYASLRVTALDGALVVNDGASPVTITTDAATDLTYTGSTDTLAIADYVDGTNVTLTDASGLIDAITVAVQGGKALGAVVMTGDLDSFTGADGDYASLRVTALDGALVVNDGASPVTITTDAETDLTYTGSTDTLAVADYVDGTNLTLTDANGLIDAITIAVQGGKALGAVVMTGDLDSFTGADGDYASLRVTALNGALVVNDGASPVTITTDAVTDLTYTGSTDTLAIADYVDGTNLTLTDASGLIDAITVAVQGGKALGAVVVNGDLDAFTGADGDYASLRVTALDGALVVNDGTNPVTITTDAVTDLTYTGSTDTLAVADYVDGTNLTLTDVNGLIDAITIAVQGGKALGAVVMTGDLDSFTGADGDYASLRVTALNGALVVNDGANPVTITTDAATDLTYTGSTDTLAVADYVDGTNLTLTDANGLIDAITVAVQVGKALGAVVMTGDLDAFTGADGDYASLRVTALDGALIVNDGSNPVTITTDAATDLTYTGSSDTLSVADFVDGTNLTLTDANGLIDAITIAVQGGKALGAVVMTGDLDAFTGADGDYASLRVTALNGALVVNDGANPVTITTDAVADLTYTGSTDTLAVADYVDGTNLTLTDANGLIDAITVAVQGGKALGAVVMNGDLDSFTGADGDYASLRVTALNGTLVVNDGTNPVSITTDAATDLTYTGSTDTLAVADFVNGTNLTLTDANGLIDAITIAAQSGRALGAVVMTGDLDAFTGADGDYASLRVTALDGALVVHDGTNPVTILTDAAMDLTYTGTSDTLAVADFVAGSNLTLTDANGLIDSITIATQAGKALGAVVMTGDLDAFTAADSDYSSLRVTALDGALVLSDGTNPVTITATAVTDITYTAASDTLAIADFVNGANLTLTDASGLVDTITVAAQAGKALGLIAVDGDLDAFTAADGDYGRLRVTSVVGDLLLTDGTGATVQFGTAGTLDLSYVGAADALTIHGYGQGSGLTVANLAGLVDSITVMAQVGSSLGAVQVTGDLNAFTATAASAFDTLTVTAATGTGAAGLTISDGGLGRTIELGTGSVNLTYTSLAIAQGGALQILGTTATDATSVLEIRDQGTGLRITSVQLSGVMQGFDTNAIVGDLVASANIQTIAAGQFVGTLTLPQLTTANGLAGTLLTLIEGGSAVALDVDLANALLGLRVTGVNGGLEFFITQNVLAGLALSITDPGALIQVIQLGQGVEDLFTSYTHDNPNSSVVLEARPPHEDAASDNRARGASPDSPAPMQQPGYEFGMLRAVAWGGADEEEERGDTAPLTSRSPWVEPEPEPDFEDAFVAQQDWETLERGEADVAEDEAAIDGEDAVVRDPEAGTDGAANGETAPPPSPEGETVPPGPEPDPDRPKPDRDR